MSLFNLLNGLWQTTARSGRIEIFTSEKHCSSFIPTSISFLINPCSPYNTSYWTSPVVSEATIATLTALRGCQVNRSETKIGSIVTVKPDSSVLPVELII